MWTSCGCTACGPRPRCAARVPGCAAALAPMRQNVALTPTAPAGRATAGSVGGPARRRRSARPGVPSMWFTEPLGPPGAPRTTGMGTYSGAGFTAGAGPSPIGLSAGGRRAPARSRHRPAPRPVSTRSRPSPTTTNSSGTTVSAERGADVWAPRWWRHARTLLRQERVGRVGSARLSEQSCDRDLEHPGQPRRVQRRAPAESSSAQVGRRRPPGAGHLGRVGGEHEIRRSPGRPARGRTRARPDRWPGRRRGRCTRRPR